MKLLLLIALIIVASIPSNEGMALEKKGENDAAEVLPTPERQREPTAAQKLLMKFMVSSDCSHCFINFLDLRDSSPAPS